MDCKHGILPSKRCCNGCNEMDNMLYKCNQEIVKQTCKVEQLEQQLAAANARVEELEKDNARQKRLATISRLCKNVQACRAEKAETKIKQMEDAIKFDFERFMDFQRRAEQAESQCALLKQENSKLAMASIEQPPYKQDLIDRMKRMEDALREITNVTSKCLSHEEMKDKMKHIAKAALEEKP